MDIHTKSKDDFQKRFKRNFLTLDILIAITQFVEFITFGYDGLIFIAAGSMFTLDAILLIWLLSYKGPKSNSPKYVLYLNCVSNALTIIVYSIGRVFVVFAIGPAQNAKIYQKLIAATLFIVFTPMKLIKLYIMYSYKKFCVGGDATDDPKYENLLASFDIPQSTQLANINTNNNEKENIEQNLN